MKANELRIGNYVEGVDGIDQILTIEEGGCKLLNFNDPAAIEEPIHFFDWITPIKLTEEWFLKLGFESMPVDNTSRLIYKNPSATIDVVIDYYHPETEIIIRKDYSGYSLREFTYDTKIRYRIEFVHELQNLYFALTGEELTVS